MPDFKLTDSLNNSVTIPKFDWKAGSSLSSYLKTAVLHLVVAPDFLQRKDKVLTEAAPSPLTFQLEVGHEFELGGASPEISVRPGAHVIFVANASPGTDLFEGDPFKVPFAVPAGTGYTGLSLEGSLKVGVSGSTGKLSFGIDANRVIKFEYYRAFSLGQNQPTLAAAASDLFANFTIPGSVEDLANLRSNDVCAVSGMGSLKVSVDVTVSAPVNPLASVNLPLGTGKVAVKDGLITDVSASVKLTGTYQIRLERLESGSIRLSYLKMHGTNFEADLSASAGIGVEYDKTDLLGKLLGAIGKDKIEASALEGLTDIEKAKFTDAVKDGVDHSVHASVALALSSSRQDEVAFQYELNPAQFDAEGTDAINHALRGDLSLLTAMEHRVHGQEIIAPGIKLLNSVLASVRQRGASLHVNLIGIVNLISLSKLLENCEFLFEPASGDLTIKEAVQSDRISAITDPLKRHDALRKAMFDSVLATATYVVGRTVAIPAVRCSAMHFAMNQNTNAQTMADYASWFGALNLLTSNEQAELSTGFVGGGPSTCAVRAEFDEPACDALFFDKQGTLRPEADYLEIGRKALKTLLDPERSDVDRARFRVLDDPATWARALQIGPSPALSEVVPLAHSSPQFQLVLNDISGDLYDVVWWADGMHKAGQALQKIRTQLKDRVPGSLPDDAAIADQKESLHKLMVGVVAASKLRFHDPWGMISLFRAAGGTKAWGKITARGFVLERVGGFPAKLAGAGE